MHFSKTTVLALVAAASASPVNPWEAYRDERSCAGRGYAWKVDRCIERKEARQDWRAFRDQRACAEHGFRWDVRHGCGPLSGIYKREEQTQEQLTPWEVYHDERSCAGRGYYWNVNRCIARKEERQAERAWGAFTNPAACASHGYRWDVRHGCGPLSGLAGTLPRPYKRDVDVSPWEAFHDEATCARNHYFWNAGRCAERKEERQEAREQWRDFKDERECATHGFKWDVRHGCGPLAKRDVAVEEQRPEWRAGPWDSWRDRDACERHSYRWDLEHNRCGDVAAAAAVGNVAGGIASAVANGVSALTGGIVGAVNQYQTEQECAAHSARWDREHRRCW